MGTKGESQKHRENIAEVLSPKLRDGLYTIDQTKLTN